MRRRVVLISVGLALVLLGVGIVAAFQLREPPTGGLETNLADVSLFVPPDQRSPRAANERPDKRESGYGYPAEACWRNFGGDPERTLSRPYKLGEPRRSIWARGMGELMEFPPVYCDGTLYVNLEAGRTVALSAHTGKIRWTRRTGRIIASSPAIAGPLLIVTAKSGSVTALRRSNGRVVWRLMVGSAVESSPVVVDRTAYLGTHDGRVYAIAISTGRIRWAYRTGGQINSSPSVIGKRVCVTTYAGAVICLRRRDGHEVWTTYVRRDAFRFESFYASPSSDGLRLFTIARTGKLLALSASSGKILWTRHRHTLSYPTPAVANGRLFVGGFDGVVEAYRTVNGRTLWRRSLEGEIIAPAMVTGNLVFVSTLSGRTYALRAADGTVVWSIRAGAYSPGIATNRRYYFTLNGLLAAFRPERQFMLRHA